MLKFNLSNIAHSSIRRKDTIWSELIGSASMFPLETRIFHSISICLILLVSIYIPYNLFEGLYVGSFQHVSLHCSTHSSTTIPDFRANSIVIYYLVSLVSWFFQSIISQILVSMVQQIWSGRCTFCWYLQFRHISSMWNGWSCTCSVFCWCICLSFIIHRW